MKDLPKFLFFLILLIFPLFSFLVYKGTGMDSFNIFGFICVIFLTYRLICIYQTGTDLIVPNYIIIFGVFTAYTILSSIFITDKFAEVGAIKYLYSNAFIMTFVSFLIVENTNFSPRWIKFSIKILGATLILAAIVSVIQIHDPLFFRKNENLVQGLSYDRMTTFYIDNPTAETGTISRFFAGYRFSIYSYIDEISVGIDSISAFSLLLALKSNNWLRSLIWILAAALVSFLSSSRWIMVNFLVVASQNIWINKDKVWNALKYALYFIGLLLILVPAAEFAGIDVHKFTKERLMSKDASTRILAFSVFSKVFPDNPIFGTGGVDTIKVKQLLDGRSSQIHVGYLKLFYYYGLVGGIIYLTFLVSLLTRMWKMARQSNYWGGFFAILPFFIANLTLARFNLFYYGLLLALIFSNHFYYESNKVLIPSKKYNSMIKAKGKELKLPQC